MKVITGKQTGSHGAGLSVTALPPVTTKRWVARRKAAVISAVRNGVLTMGEACRRYGLSGEEFAEWERHYEAEGLKGLRAQVRLHHPDYPMH
jgi:hypothetical protein